MFQAKLLHESTTPREPQTADLFGWEPALSSSLSAAERIRHNKKQLNIVWSLFHYCYLKMYKEYKKITNVFSYIEEEVIIIILLIAWRQKELHISLQKLIIFALLLLLMRSLNNLCMCVCERLCTKTYPQSTSQKTVTEVKTCLTLFPLKYIQNNAVLSVEATFWDEILYYKSSSVVDQHSARETISSRKSVLTSKQRAK